MYFLVDWVKRIDFDRMRELRTARLREKMAEFGLDGMALFKVENVNYASGVQPSWMPSVPIRNATMLSREPGDIACFVASGNWSHRVKTSHWLKSENIKPFPLMEHPVVARKTGPAMKQAITEIVGLTRGRVGVDLFPIYLYEALAEEMPDIQFVDGNACFNAAIAVKNEEELKCFRTAAACMDVGMDRAVARVDVGARECEILGAGLKGLYNLGMGMPQGKPVVASGENLNPLARLATDRAVRNGELVYIDFGGCFNSFWGELARTVVCGHPTQRQKEVYRAAYGVLTEVISSIRPGATGRELMEKARSVAAQHGMADYIWPDLGHGIGVSGWEPPVLSADHASPLEAGMTLVVKVIITAPRTLEGATVGLSDLAIVTEDGCEVVTRTPFDEVLLN